MGAHRPAVFLPFCNVVPGAHLQFGGVPTMPAGHGGGGQRSVARTIFPSGHRLGHCAWVGARDPSAQAAPAGAHVPARRHHTLRAPAGAVRQRNHSRPAIGTARAVGEALTARTAIGERTDRTRGRASIHCHADASIATARARAGGTSAGALGCADEVAGATGRTRR